MKVCSTCQARFLGNEAFCPHDGTRLVEARELSPGELTGTVLNEVVSLTRLSSVDALAERYEARLTATAQSVAVSVFNQGLSPAPSRRAQLREAIETLGTPLPQGILEVHSFDLECDPAYVVEAEPKGPSLKSLLAEKKALDWQSAVRLVCTIGRALDWLADHGLIHRGLNLGTVYVSDLREGQIQLGGWAQGLISYVDSPIKAAESKQAYLGFTAYLAPEAAENNANVDSRSLVYALAMILYELVVGKSAFSSQDESETLKRHLHEKPLKLAIACAGTELPPQIDDILEMMWAKSPNKRFQSIAAAIAALSSLLDADPMQVAPLLERAEVPVFQPAAITSTIAMSAVDTGKASLNRETSQHGAISLHSTSLGAPGAAFGLDETSELSEASASNKVDDAWGEELAVQPGSATIETRPETMNSPSLDSIIVEDEQDEHESEPDSGPVPTLDSIIVEEQSEPKSDPVPTLDPLQAESEDDEGSTTTLMISDAEEKAREDYALVEEPAKKTLLMRGINLSEHTAALEDKTEQPQADASPAAPIEQAAAEEAAEALADDSDAQLDSTSEPQTAAKPESKSKSKSKSRSKNKANASAPRAGAITAPEITAPEITAPAIDDKIEPKAAGAVEKPKSGLNIGFVEVAPANSKGGEIGDEWFADSAEDAWENSLVREHREQSQQSERTIQIGIAIAVVLMAIGAYVIFENYSGDEASGTKVAAEVEAPTPVIDMASLRRGFDAAITAGELIFPRRTSALGLLEQMQRHDKADPIFDEARATFVQEAYSQSKQANDAGKVRQARDLAGYASQFDSEDSELKAWAELLHARVVADLPASSLINKPVEVQNDPAQPEDEVEQAPAEIEEVPAVVEKAPPVVEEVVAVVEPTPAKEVRAPVTTPTVRVTPTPTPVVTTTPDSDVNSLVENARSAYSRGNLAEARKLYSQALTSTPNNHVIHAGLGQIYFEEAAHDKALQHQGRAVELRPNHVGYRVQLGMVYFRLQRYKEAISAWEAVLRQDPNNDVAKRYIELAQRRLN
ncbi:MAG: tetratricopeptide repeat protein [Bradymonadaceae bacterium]|nr:tetratricopeptide repeat protein [Lujinxingiaceae bacterium]